MKKNIYILLVTVLLIFGSCKKLDRDFVTTITKDQFLTTFSLINGLINSVYTELPDGLLYINGNAMMASATDEAEFTNDTNPVQLFNDGSWNAINNPDNGSNGTTIANTTIWAQYYRGIRKANQLIVSTGQINNDIYKFDPTPSGQLNYAARLAIIKRWTFEARFLRAYFYFELIKRYGGVPLISTELPFDADFSQIKRNTLQECINFIVSECDATVPELPTNVSQVGFDAATDLGHVTKFCALALKSRVLLYAASDLFNNPSWASGYAQPELISLPSGDRNTRWKAASDAAKACIDAVGISSLSTGYKALFNTYQNAELIFFRNKDANNTFERTNYPIGFPSGGSGNTPSQGLVDAYEVRIGASGASATSVPFDWTNPAHVANIYNFSLTAPIARDPRMNFTVVTNGYDPAASAPANSGSITNGAVFGNPARFVQTYVGGADGPPITFATKTGYYLRKFLNESSNIPAGQAGIHSWIIFRVSEMFMNYAEALNEWSPGNPDIKKYVDIVRTRTGVNMPPLPVGLSQEQMRQRIRNEDRVEFAFEDHRAWDTRRWMIAPATLGAPLRGISITGVRAASVYTPIIVENRVFTPKMYLYPIPQTEINTSPVLVQNPLW